MWPAAVNSPERVQPGRGQVGSSVTAGSCSPASAAPGRRAGSPGPGWPGCRSCDGRAPFRGGSPCCRGSVGGLLERHLHLLLLRCQTCLSFFRHGLREEVREFRWRFLDNVPQDTHLMWARWPAPCSLVEEWGASPGWRVWGGSWMSRDWGRLQSCRSGHGSGNTCWTNDLWRNEMVIPLLI